MSFKSIELQVAIPRSQDAGKMQEQMMKQGQQFQETLTQQQLKDEALKRQMVNQFDSVEDQIIKEEEKQQEKHDRQDENEAKKKKSENQQPMKHPYLGKNVDFSG